MARNGSAGTEPRPKTSGQDEPPAERPAKFPQPSAVDAFWEAEAEKLEDPIPAPRIPLAVLVQEIQEVARFCQRYREPQQRIDGKWLPGLAQIGDEAGLPSNMDEQLLELLQAYQAAEARYRLLVDPPKTEAVKEGRAALRELKAALKYCARENRVLEKNLRTWHKLYGGSRTTQMLGAALGQYANLAEQNAEALAKLPGFDLDLIQQARTLSLEAGGTRPGTWTSPPSDQDPELALRTRNRLVHLIEMKLRAVRTAAGYVFRDHPEVLRKVTSEYGRTRQARWRAKKKQAQKQKPQKK